MKSIGFVLILLAVLAFAYQGFSYTKREKVIDVGPIEASVDKKEHVSIPPLASGLALAMGLVLVLAGRRQVTR